MLTGKILRDIKLLSRCFIHSIYGDVPIKKQTVAELIFSHCDKYSNRIISIDESTNRHYTYSEYKNAIKGITSSLTKKGILQGMMFCMIAYNSPEYYMLAFAISSMGCTVALCNPNYTEKELLYLLMDSKPSILITNEEYSKKVSKVAALLPNIKDIYLIGNRKENYKSVDDLINDSGNMCPIGNVKRDLDNDVALVVYSSGTTGFPKGVMITHNNLVTVFHQVKEFHPTDYDHRVLITVPLYHVYGICPIATNIFPTGSTMITQSKFDPIQYLSSIEKYKISLIHAVPPMIRFFLNHPEVSKFDLSSINRCYCGGAPLGNENEYRFIKKFEALNPKFKLYLGYGLTESTGVAFLQPLSIQSHNKIGSVGTLFPNMKCRIVNSSTKEDVNANEIGEVLLKGGNIMKGYLNKPKETEDTFEKGWLKTGDIGYYDNDQYFYITDRIKDLIKVKSYQVAPAELESTLLSIPGIIECAVVGIPHEKYGEVPKAFIVRNKNVEKEDINNFMEKNLSEYKQLRGGIIFVNEIPKNSSGKILRKDLK